VNRFRPLVELQAATRTYTLGGKAVEAVCDVDLALQPGTFVSIVGPSGSGKSTLLHLLGGLDKPTSGSVIVAGKNLSRLDDNELATFRLRSVGFVFQSFNLLPAMSAWENVAIPRLLAGERLRQAKPRAIELLNLVGMGSRVAHRPKELSGGEMQRVAIARALMMDPRIVLADEPTGNLDTKTGCAIVDLLRSVAYEQGDSSNARLVVIVTHDLSMAEGADRIISIQDGHVLHDRPGAVLGRNHFRHQDGAADGTWSDTSTPGTTPATSNKVPAWSRQHNTHGQAE
jgi:putative ABC transport system ATP-binding protein